jgi:hypothetical protein
MGFTVRGKLFALCLSLFLSLPFTRSQPLQIQPLEPVFAASNQSDHCSYQRDMRYWTQFVASHLDNASHLTESQVEGAESSWFFAMAPIETKDGEDQLARLQENPELRIWLDDLLSISRLPRNSDGTFNSTSQIRYDLHFHDAQRLMDTAWSRLWSIPCGNQRFATTSATDGFYGNCSAFRGTMWSVARTTSDLTAAWWSTLQRDYNGNYPPPPPGGSVPGITKGQFGAAKTDMAKLFQSLAGQGANPGSVTYRGGPGSVVYHLRIIRTEHGVENQGGGPYVGSSGKVGWSWHMESKGSGGTGTVTCSLRGQSKSAAATFTIG